MEQILNDFAKKRKLLNLPQWIFGKIFVFSYHDVQLFAWNDIPF
jgi:hypothetical protein